MWLAIIINEFIAFYYLFNKKFFSGFVYKNYHINFFLINYLYKIVLFCFVLFCFFLKKNKLK